MKLNTTLMALTAALTLTVTPLSAAELSKSEVEQIVHDYLLENPEILMEMSAKLQQRQEAQQSAQDGALLKTYAKEIYQSGSPEAGNPKGSVTIVEFFDYNCGYCKRAHPLVEAMLKEDNDIRYIYKEFPILNESSFYAAKVALAINAVEPKQYKAFHDKLSSMPGHLNNPQQVEAIVKELGIDWGKVAAKLEDPAVLKALADNRRLAENLAVSGTPGFIIGERIIRGAPQNAEMLRQLVNEARQ